MDLIFDVTVSTAERIATFGQLQTKRMREVDSVLDDVDLVFERRVDVDRGIGDEERPRIVRSVDHEDVAHAPGGMKLFLVDDRAHEFVGMEAALHQRLDLAIARQRDRLGRRRVAMFRRHEFIAGEVELGLFRGGSDFGLGPDQDGNDELLLGGFDRAQQRNRVDRMDDGRADRLQALCFLNKL